MQRQRLVNGTVGLLALLLPTAGCVAAEPANTPSPAPTVTVEPFEGRLRILINGEHFTDYIHADTPRPILYPVLGPGGAPMTRNFPMKRIDGEANDHPHHRSLWFAHGNVNGIDFWADGDNRGRIVHDKTLRIDQHDDHASITTRSHWVAPDGEVILTDERTLTFREIDNARCIDFVITLHASHGDVTLGDTKEGTMAIRTHPNLRLANGRGVTTANGRAVNSEGDRDKDLWGKRAAWVDYHGEIDGKRVGVAILDHPDNPRHPTWWHARDYGLVAANPLGIHDFENKPAGTGDMTVPAGESVTFAYRFIFHAGDTEVADIAGRYERWAAE